MQLTSFNDITTTHRHIFLSPHFDDVIYSCAGTLGVQVSAGLRPLVITVFGSVPPANLALSPLASKIHREMGGDATKGAGSIVEERRREDAAACAYMEVDYLWLDYLDAMYRGTPAYYTSNSQLIGGEVNVADLEIDRQLAESLLDLQARLPDAAWYAPLGIGRHVDHQIVCSAADRLAQRGAKVYYYEDFPYNVRDKNALEARKQELGIDFEPLLVEMSEMVPLRVAASALYASQITNNFSSKEGLEQAIENYTYGIRPVETVHLERYWAPR